MKILIFNLLIIILLIEDDENLIKGDKNEIIKPKKCKIEYNKFNIYLKEDNNNDLNNAIVITNNNFVDYLLYAINHYIIVRKFPFMIITQTINFHILNRCLIIENSNNILFINFDENEHKIKIKSIYKSKIGNK